MKRKIAILGSTGSIGKTLLKIIEKDKKNFKIELLTTNKNYNKLFEQANIFKVKNLIVADKKSYLKLIKKDKEKRFNIYNDFKAYNKIFSKKIDYVMCSIIGLSGLLPTIEIIKHTKNVVIANKESIVCAWNLILNELKKYNTKFIPVDSEHFSIWYSLKKNNIKNIDKIFLTASGGPFLNRSIHNIKRINISDAIKHPNWKMGEKISIDSATMMNKVFEIIEAKKIFNVNYDQLQILTHPSSYVHAILKFKDGLTEIVLHDTTMKIPIINTLYLDDVKNFRTKDINFKILNNLELKHINIHKFPLVKILKKLPKENSLFETILVSANDRFVELYLNGKIEFNEIQMRLWKFINNKEFEKYKRIKPKKIENIINLNKYVRLKINL